MLTGWRLRVSKLFFIPQRYVMANMCFLGTTIAYGLRVCLNIAITQMVATRNSSEIHDPNACPSLDSDVENSTTTQGEYNWDEEMQGLILSAFYYGYTVSQLLLGFIIEKYGAKHHLGIGTAITSILTLITPVVVRAGGDNPAGIITLRVLEGFAQGTIIPALSVLMARWIPKNERGKVAAVMYGGGYMGCILGTFLSGFVMSGDGDWPNVFYIFGTLGIVWYIFWQLLVYSDPRTHPFISDTERQYLEGEIEEKSTNPIPWKPMLLSMPFWAMWTGCIGYSWGYFTMFTDLPKYMNDVLKFSIAKTGMLSALSYFVMMIASFICGTICDWSIHKNHLSTKNARKISQSICTFGPAIFIIVASYAGSDGTIAVAMFCMAMGAMGFYTTGMKINCLDLVPNYAGVVTALINGSAAITGIATPYIVGYLTPNQTQEEWRIAFWITFGVLFVTNIFYLIFAQGEVLWWNDIEKNGHQQSHKNDKRVSDDDLENRKPTGNFKN